MNWIRRFFDTAPKVKSDLVLQIERAGLTGELIEAIMRDKKGLPQTGRIQVKQVR